MRAALLIAGGGAALLFAATRTQRGQAIAADVLEEISVTAQKIVNAVLPRGIRNNNPGNIEWIPNVLQRWRGMVSADGRYGVFDTAANGVRAIGGELRASIRKGHTLAQAITEWAPPSENNTEAYIAAVEQESGWPRTTRVTLGMIPAIAAPIIRHENGVQPYAFSDIALWVNS